MRHFIYFLFLLSLPFSSFAQSVQGNWIKYQAKDDQGNTVIDYALTEIAKFEIEITDKKICFLSSPLEDRICSEYLIKDNSIQAGTEWKGIIKKAHNDTLILQFPNEKKNGFNDIYFLRDQVFYDQMDFYREDGYLISSLHFSPAFNGNFEDYLRDVLSFSNFNGSFKGLIKIDFDSSLVSLDFYESNKMSNALKKRLQKHVASSFPYWTNLFKDEKKYIIPFTSRMIDSNLGLYIINFFTEEYQSEKEIWAVSESGMRKSKSFFKKGYTAYENKEYADAMNLFRKAYQADHTNLEALYNLAAIHLEHKQKVDACKVWSILASRGQQKAKLLIKNYCTN